MSDQTEPQNMAEALDSAGVASLLLARDNDVPGTEPAPATPAEAPAPTAPRTRTEPAPADEDEGPVAVSIPTGDEEEPEPEPDPAEEPDPAATSWPESARKRVDKLTAQKHALAEEKGKVEARARELEERLAEASRTVPPAPGDDPHADITTPDALEERRSAATKALDWLLANPYGGEVPDGKGGHVSLSAQDVAERRSHVERVLHVQLPQRERWLAEHARHAQAASQVYPELFKAGPQSDAAFSVLRAMPELQRRPDFVLTVGDLLVGRAVRSGKYVLVPRGERKAAAPRTGPPAVPPATAPAAAPAGTGREREAEVARTRFAESGDAHDLARVIEARLAS